MSTVSYLTNQVMIQRKSKGSLAFCSLPGYERLASLADFLFRPTPLPRLFAGYITYTENEIKGFYDQLLILKIKTKTLTTSDRGKTAVSRKVVGKARLIAHVNPAWYCGSQLVSVF